MSTGLYYLDVGIGIAVLCWVLWWMHTLTTKSRAQRKLERAPARSARQPWGDDRPGGRGNR
jgi:hypothetical protein